MKFSTVLGAVSSRSFTRMSPMLVTNVAYLVTRLPPVRGRDRRRAEPHRRRPDRSLRTTGRRPRTVPGLPGRLPDRLPPRGAGGRPGGRAERAGRPAAPRGGGAPPDPPARGNPGGGGAGPANGRRPRRALARGPPRLFPILKDHEGPPNVPLVMGATGSVGYGADRGR